MSALDFGKLGFGGAGIGNLYRQMHDDDAHRTLQAAWDGGIRYFDSAPHYGLGLSERRIGKFLADKPREDYLISTKAGKLLIANPAFTGQQDDEGFDVPAEVVRHWDPTETGIRRSLEESLERLGLGLGLESIDILYLHDPDAYDLEAGITTALPAMARLREEGLVKAIGVGANSADALSACVRSADLDLIMLAGRYTLLEQPSLADLLPLCMDRGVEVVNVGVFNSGLLASSTIRPDAHYNYQPAPLEILARARSLAAVCAEYDVELPAAALQFSLRHPAVRTVVAGAKSPAQVRQNIDHMESEIPDELWDALHGRGLVSL